jgi:hypothetical protein
MFACGVWWLCLYLSALVLCLGCLFVVFAVSFLCGNAFVFVFSRALSLSISLYLSLSLSLSLSPPLSLSLSLSPPYRCVGSFCASPPVHFENITIFVHHSLSLPTDLLTHLSLLFLLLSFSLTYIRHTHTRHTRHTRHTPDPIKGEPRNTNCLPLLLHLFLSHSHHHHHHPTGCTQRSLASVHSSAHATATE